MSRSGYSDDCAGWELTMWRGAVVSAINGARGQAFLREMLAALDAMPEKRLTADELVTDHGCCALGAVVRARGLDDAAKKVDYENPAAVAGLLGIARAMAAEIAYENDDGYNRPEKECERWARMRAWVVENLKEDAPS